MAPNNRLEEKLRKLGLSHDDTGSSHSSSASKLKHSFRIYFPLPPYDGLQFNALRSGPGFNFTGQLLGIGGKQLQRIKQESSARVEVVNAQGNLNGAHPDPLDPELHALITADSMGKLQKAADMVWDLLQPVNARYQPIEVTPGGSVRLTVMQTKKSSKSSKFTTSSSAAAPDALGKPQSGGASQPAAAEGPSRSLTVSPAVTPVTPAATAVSNAAFTARHSSHSSNCSQSCTSPSIGHSGCTNTSTCGSSISRSSLSRTNSSIQVALFTCPDDDFALPPAAVSSAMPKSAARRLSVDASPVVTSETCKIQSAKNSIKQAEDQQAENQHAESTGTASDLQPQTPNAEQTATALPAVNRGAGLLTSQAESSAALTKGPLAALKVEQKQQSWSPAIGPEGSNNGSCSSCFQYGLGLCNSSSWDSPLSCGSKESPALQALIVDHQRQQQQQLEQLQLMQTGLRGQPLTPAGFSDVSMGHGYSGFAVGSFPGDGFNLGPAALLPATAVSGSRCSSTLPPPAECMMQTMGSRYVPHVPASDYEQLQYHEQQSMSKTAAHAAGQAGMGWGVHAPGAGAIPMHSDGAGCEFNCSYAASHGIDSVCAQSAWPLSQREVQNQQSMMLMQGQQQQQQHCLGSWGKACSVFATTRQCGSYDQVHALSNSIW